MKYLADGLKFYISLQTLSFFDNNLSTNPEDMKYLADGLKSNTSLKKLNLGGNYIRKDYPEDMNYRAEIDIVLNINSS